MSLLKNVLILFLIAISVVQNWLLLAGALIIYYSLFYRLEALIGLAILIDGYFGNFAGWPWLSVLSIFWYLTFYSLRQKIVNMKEA
jgi:hypothetical protein